MNIILIGAGLVALWLLNKRKGGKNGTSPTATPPNTYIAPPKPNASSTKGDRIPTEEDIRANESRLRELYFFHPVNVPKQFEFIRPSDNHKIIMAGWALKYEEVELVNEDIAERKLNDIAGKLGGGQYGTVVKKLLSYWDRLYGHGALSASSGQFSVGPRFKAKSLKYPFGYTKEMNRLRALGLETSMPRGIVMYKNWQLDRPDPTIPKDALLPALVFASPYDALIFWVVRAIELYGAKQSEKDIAQDLIKARGDEEWANRLSSIFR